MDPLSPLLIWLVATCLGALAGLLGGMGGRALRWHQELGQLWEQIELIERRLSKREGSEGQRRKQQNAETAGSEVERAQQLIARLTARQPPQLVSEPADPITEATEFFSARDKRDRSGKLGTP